MRCSRSTLVRFMFYLLVAGSLQLAACSNYTGLKRNHISTETPTGSYTWDNFFNDGCGPAQAVWFRSDGTGELIYQCTGGSKMRQSLRHMRTEGAVELWAANGFPEEQLRQLSPSKCQAVLIYFGSESLTVKYPCALVHLTIALSIQSSSAHASGLFVRITPTTVLITYSDGLQEFDVLQDRLVPKSPFQPFSLPPKPPMHTSRIGPHRQSTNGAESDKIDRPDFFGRVADSAI